MKKLILTLITGLVVMSASSQQKFPMFYDENGNIIGWSIISQANGIASSNWVLSLVFGGETGTNNTFAVYGPSGLIDSGIAADSILATMSDVGPYVYDPDILQTQITANAEAIDAIDFSSATGFVDSVIIGTTTNVPDTNGVVDITGGLEPYAVDMGLINQITTNASRPVYLQVNHSGDNDASGVTLSDSYIRAGELYSKNEADNIHVLINRGTYEGYPPYFEACPYDLTVRGLIRVGVTSTAYSVGLSGLIAESSYHTTITNSAFSDSGENMLSTFYYEGINFETMVTPNVPSDWSASAPATNRIVFRNSRFEKGAVDNIGTYVGNTVINWLDFEGCEFISGGVIDGVSAGNTAYQFGNVFSNCYFADGVTSRAHGTNLPSTLYSKIWSDSSSMMFSGGTTTRAGAPFRIKIEDAYIVADDIFQYQGQAGVGGEAASYVICDDVDFTNTVYGSWDIQGPSIFRNCTRIDGNQTNYPAVSITNCTDETNTPITDQ